MTSTLIVRPVAGCDLSHPLCPFSTSVSKGLDTLHPKVLQSLLNKLGDYVFDEAVIACPNPLLHPKFEAIASAVHTRARRVSLLTPVTGLSKLTRTALRWVDELVIVSASAEELRREEGRLRALLSQGIDNVSVYATVTRGEATILVTSEHVSFCRKYGVTLRVGELPYVGRVPLRLREALLEEGYEVSMPYGVKYGYVASTAFMNGYRLTVLERPSQRSCRSLYIDYYGRVGKCPFLRPEGDAATLSRDALRRIIYSKCPARRNPLNYVPEIKISLRVGDGVVIPPEVLALLEVVESTNSLRAACRLLGYSPSTYLEKLRTIEAKLGFKLIITKRGGSSKGLTLLTEEGLRILEAYRRVREAIMNSLIKEGVEGFAFEH